MSLKRCINDLKILRLMIILKSKEKNSNNGYKSYMSSEYKNEDIPTYTPCNGFVIKKTNKDGIKYL